MILWKESCSTKKCAWKWISKYHQVLFLISKNYLRNPTPIMHYANKTFYVKLVKLVINSCNCTSSLLRKHAKIEENYQYRLFLWIVNKLKFMEKLDIQKSNISTN
jgi:hypothetical protein